MNRELREPVLRKSDWYARAATGEFGNGLPRFETVREWWDSHLGFESCELWGVQHKTIAGYPGTRLDVPRRDVPFVIRDKFDGPYAYNYIISPMVHQFGSVLWEGDIMRGVDGLSCHGHARPAPGSWRRHMAKPDVWKGSAATALLRSVLNGNSYDDLELLLDGYPDHVVELTALSRCYGTCPGRNAVVWECRRY